MTTLRDLTVDHIGRHLVIKAMAGGATLDGHLRTIPTPGLPKAHFKLRHTGHNGNAYDAAHILHWDEPVTVLCPTCDGHGHLNTDPDEYQLPRIVVCHTCAGTGNADGPVVIGEPA